MRKLDLLDLRMMEALGEYGPRNITGLARKLKVPSETLRKRLRRARSHISLYANVYHANLGLQKAVVHAQALPGQEQLLLESMKANDFWSYVDRVYGINEGCLGIYAIPKDHSSEFEDFVHELEKLGVAFSPKLVWSTCFQAVHARAKWFDPETRQWAFHWDEWIKEIPTETTRLPKTLVDPKDFPVLADETDIFILKELEKDPTVTITDLGKMLGISQQLAEYHYQKHVVARGLLESFDVSDFRSDAQGLDSFFFFLTFDSMEKLARFANSLIDKPFARGLAKVLGEKLLLVHVHLPKPEFRSFVDCLSQLVNSEHLDGYSYIIQDLGKAQRQPLSHEYFNNDSWRYDHNKHVKKLKSLVNRH